MTIAQMNQRFNLSTDTLRYYERIGLIPSVRRTSGGILNYSEEDCKRIECIKCMRCAGLAIGVFSPIARYLICRRLDILQLPYEMIASADYGPTAGALYPVRRFDLPPENSRLPN